MTNKAVRRAVLQIALLVTLVATANAIKPFSPGNVMLHTLGTARSFSFVLPSVAVERIEQANYLAQAYGKGLLDGSGSNSIWAPQNAFQSSQLELLAASLSGEPSVEAEIKDVESCGTGKKHAPAKRAVRRLRPGTRDDREEAAGSSKAKEVTRPAVQSVAMTQPEPLPAFLTPALLTVEDAELNLTGARLIPTSGKFPLPAASKLGNCGQAEVQVVKLTATVRELPILPNVPTVTVSLLLMPQPATLISRCREPKPVLVETETEEAASSTETTVGPQEEFFGETFSDPMATPAPPGCPQR
jgi:hypothetical protein